MREQQDGHGGDRLWQLHQYEHTVNTLKYADRAKEIKTHVHENRGTVETHIAEYQRMIDALQERRELRAEVDRLKGGGGQVGGRARASPPPSTKGGSHASPAATAAGTAAATSRA